VESVTALRNLHAAPKGASTPQEEAARGGVESVTALAGERYRPEPPQRHAGRRDRQKAQREQAAEAQPAARPQEGAGRRRQGERRRRHAWPHGTD
jgi:hypothetical protein